MTFLDSSKLNISKLDLNKINEAQPLKIEKSDSDKRFSIRGWFNIFNNRLRANINFKWRF